jgi:glucokinase
MAVPVAFKYRGTNKNTHILAGDIGGTKVNMALYEVNENDFNCLLQDSFHSKDYQSLTEIVKEFIGLKQTPSKICLAVAGPVFNGKVNITNLPWHCDSHQLSADLGGTDVVLINDLEATAYGLAGLKDTDLCSLNKGNPSIGGNIGIIAPGTGLGEAGLYWDGKEYYPFACEGGHCSFASQDDFDFEFYKWMKKQFDHISWEMVVSGPGIRNIFHFLTAEKKMKANENVLAEIQIEDPSAVISENALSGNCEVSKKTMQLFTIYLAREASSLALKYKATGGIFIGGGIPPKILPLLQEDGWYDYFLESDRMQTLLQQVPVNVILNDKTALLGAAYYGAFNMQ